VEASRAPVNVKIVFAIAAFVMVSSLHAEEKEITKDKSPDREFALRIGGQNDPGYSDIGIVDLSTPKVLLNLGSLGHPNEENTKLVWSPYSLR
jgi:hypothetical protein